MLKEQKRPVLIGVSGGSGSGKTTVSDAIFHRLVGNSNSLLILHQDSYYKDQSKMTMTQRRGVNYDHPNAFDMDLLISQLKRLLNYQPVDIPIYDYGKLTRSSKTRHQQPCDVIILEGIFALYSERLRDLMDIKVYVDADDDIRLIRRIHRDLHERHRTLKQVIQQYLATVRPMFHQFIKPTKRYADVIIPEGGENQVAIDLLTTKIRSILKSHGNYHEVH